MYPFTSHWSNEVTFFIRIVGKYIRTNWLNTTLLCIHVSFSASALFDLTFLVAKTDISSYPV